MKTKQEIVDIFLKKGILSNKTELIRRPFNWRRHFDAEAQEIFHQFAQLYRSEAEAWFCLCRNVELPICPICHTKKVKFTGMTKNGGLGYNTTCEDCSANAVPMKIDKAKQSFKNRSNEKRALSIAKRRATNKQLYGDENYMLFGSKSFKQNLKDKYGNENFNNIEKRRRTCIDKYGVSTNLLVPEVHNRAVKSSWSEKTRKKRIDNCMNLRGVKNLLCLKSVQDEMQAIKKANIEKIEKKYNCTMLATVFRKYGQGFKKLGLEYLYIDNHVFVSNDDIPLIEKYHSEGTHSNGYVSKLEKEVLSYIKNIYSGIIEENTTSVVPNENHRFFELDIYLPEIKLAIDINGTYWHSTNFKDINYHQRKTRCCRKCGVSLLHIFEDDWRINIIKCKNIVQDCIHGTFKNVIEIMDNGCIIGDNSKPIYGNYEIVQIT